MKLLLKKLALASVLLAAASAHADDPYIWLEDVTGEKALSWVKDQNKVTRNKLDGDAGFNQLRGDLLKVLNSRDRIPGITKIGNHVYNFWTDADHPRGVWRRTTFADYRNAQPNWETVLDIDALGKNENVNWVYKGAQCLQPKYERCLVSLSRGGADAVEVREFNLPGKTFIKEGYFLPESKLSVSWRDENSIYVATDFGPNTMTDSGYARIVKEWKRGTPLAEAKTIFEGKKEDMGVGAAVAEHRGHRYEFVSRQITFYTSESFLREGDRLVKIDVPEGANVSGFADQILITLRQDWTVGGTTYKAGSLLVKDFESFKKGDRQFFVLFKPTLNSSYIGSISTKNYLLVETLEDVKSALHEWRLENGKWTSRKVNLPTFGSVGVAALDDETSDEYFLSYSDYLTPSVLELGQAGSDKRELLKSTPAFFDGAPYETVQKFATSKDGTKVPYFLVKRKDLKLDGKNPTLLYGYGGFEVSLTPSYSGGIGKAWLEKGGVYVVANIRGGGEYGPRWHQAALKSNRQRAYDDFAAVAQDLIKSKITSPRHLGAMGGSNGGLLAGVALTQQYKLYNAVVSQVPLLDMQRYNKLLAGASWMGEYGNPDVPAEWNYIKKFSPYHNVKAGVNYPNVLFITSTRDDRVHPGHARKMAAKMIGQGHKNVWYYENIEGGHGGAANNEQRADMNAITFTFLWNHLK